MTASGDGRFLIRAVLLMRKFRLGTTSVASKTFIVRSTGWVAHLFRGGGHDCAGYTRVPQG